MRIDKHSSDTMAEFRDIPVGSCFWIENTLYIRASNINSSVSLESGNEAHFAPHRLVMPEPRAKIVFDKE